METKDAYTILEFCARHGISRSAFYNAVKAGEGPKLMHVGNRVMISSEAAADWRRDREAAAASLSPEDVLRRSERARKAAQGSSPPQRRRSESSAGA